MIHRTCCDPMHSVTSHLLNSVDEATDTVRSSFALIRTTGKNQLEADVILAKTRWRPNDHCRHWFRQAWLLKSFRTIDAMVVKPVRVVTTKIGKTLYRGLSDGCTGEQVFFCQMSIPKSSSCRNMLRTHVSSRRLDTQQLSECLLDGANGPITAPL